MDTASNSIPFLDDLRRKWQDGDLSAGQALKELALWEDDVANRTGPELEAAWAMRSEIEAAASAPVPPPAPSPTSYTVTEAPPPIQASSSNGANGDEQAYDLIPRLRDIAAEAAAARSRRDWERIASLRAEADELTRQHAADSGTRLSMPDNLAATFTSATEAQEAERLVDEADAARRKGDFSEAAYRLAEASRLDPRYTPLSAAQQLVSDLQRTMRDLRDNSPGAAASPEELVEARKLARRLLEEDAAPESEYASKKLADIEGERDRRVKTSRQYIDADLATLDEPGSLDDKLECITRLGTELDKIETLQPDAPDLPDLRSRYIYARRQLDRLKPERDNLLLEIGNLDPQKGFDAARVGGIMQRLEVLAASPLARGDGNIGTAAQNLTHRLNAYLSSRLSGNVATPQMDAAALYECEQVLALAQRGPHPLSAQQVNTYNAAIQKARGASQPATATPVPTPTHPSSVAPGSTPPAPGTAQRPGSVPPGTGPAPRGGSTPPPPLGGTVPIPNSGSMPHSMPSQGSQYRAAPGAPPQVPPASGYGTTIPTQYTPPQYTPPPVQGAAVAKTEVKRGMPVLAWLLPLLIVLGAGGFFGWSAYQNGENEKRIQAQATATAHARATQTVVAERTADAAQVIAILTADAQSTAEAQETTVAEVHATETEIARVETAIVETAVAAETATAGAAPVIGAKANIQSMTVDHNVTQSGEKGMLIHLKFTIDNVKGRDCKASAYFYYATGEKLLDTNGKLNTTDGQVAVSTDFKPGFDSTQYDDLTIFMPVSELDLPAGEFDLKFRVEIYNLPKVGSLATSEFYEFNVK
ncbi:MAG TPA: hypothetical protein VJ183_11265 [Chloroflexia bacterium]|nr:hypothetical protein [Chloroflexia bacterium]